MNDRNASASGADGSAAGALPPGRRWHRALRIIAVAYPIALVAVIVAFRYVGERWWVTALGLYLPRLGFGLPLPLLTLGLLLARSYRWLSTQALALVLLLFPLMGLHLSRTRAPAPGGSRLRVITFNINEGRAGLEAIVARVRAEDPDLVVFQESGHVERAPLEAAFTGYFFDLTDQFVLASRFPVEERFFPPPLPAAPGARARTRRFVRYRIATPGGPIHLYNVHPVSPREGIDELRGEGLRHELASGRIFAPDTGDLVSDTALRIAQIGAAAEDAARSALPVLIAGDTNLPELSWALARSLGRYRDAFADVGSGFGYTFPAGRRPAWLRIDRILADDRFRFLRATVLRERLSDHFALMAELEMPSGSR